MNLQEAAQFLLLLDLQLRHQPSYENQSVNVALPFSNDEDTEYVELVMQKIKEQNYASMLEDSSFGRQIVVTDRVEDGDS